MKRLIAIACLAALASPAAWARDDCRRPMAEWQPREAVTAHAAERGITTERLRIDDGCYELRGRDGDGNWVELKLDPATLAILALEVRFGPGADPARYLPATRGPAPRSGRPAAARPAASAGMQ